MAQSILSKIEGSFDGVMVTFADLSTEGEKIRLRMSFSVFPLFGVSGEFNEKFVSALILLLP